MNQGSWSVSYRKDTGNWRRFAGVPGRKCRQRTSKHGVGGRKAGLLAFGASGDDDMPP